MRRRRRSDNSGDSNSNAFIWLITYGDLVTLCLTFFVLLYSFSTLDNQKWQNVMTSLQGSLGVLDGGPSVNEGFSGNGTGFDGNSNTNGSSGQNAAANGQATGQDSDASGQGEVKVERVDEFLKYQEEMKKLEGIKGDLNTYLQAKGLSTSITVDVEERGLVLRFQDSVLFERGKADIISQSNVILKEISNILKETDNGIRIEGHTDNLPIHTERFPSNWELSTSRATNVLRFLIQQGMPGEKLSAVGYGEYHPLIPNTDEESRRKNRRVDIVILRESMQKNEPR